ncbi:RdgB/HAM1 family non-canonical purine NTP pyrophosphatase [Geodermatophilus sp. CPCC 205761]|uniref:RdgB/HAM1 family non-canonical purine NTP pyrophosphatase n=1 Tax=Geodermatophilus sp. CPCC 205761 TaxID=2936597 RepID=UPI003EEEE3EB
MSGRLLLATRNAGKLAELQRLLESAVPGMSVVGLADVASYPEAPETGATFAENALLKAREAVRYTGLPAVADDSGLAVDAMNGMPGVLSARWSGRHGDDDANTALLLGQLADVPDERRGAAFVCAAALVTPHGGERVLERSWRGRVIREKRGSNGFGYDPVFVPEGLELTSAELAPAEKDARSHRGQAFAALVPVVAELLGRA